MWSAKSVTMHGAGARLTDTEASRDGFFSRVVVLPRIYLESLGFRGILLVPGGGGRLNPICGDH